MSVKQEQKCRICLKVAVNDYQEIDEVMKQMFRVLLLKFDLDLTRDPLICKDCIEVAKKCLNFKFTCIKTEQIILSYSTGRKNTKYGINVIYDEWQRVQLLFDGDLDTCRFCMARFERNNFSSSDTLIKENVFDMAAYLPEMDFNLTERPVICTSCRRNLEDYYNFLINCLDIEDKIKITMKCIGTPVSGIKKAKSKFTFEDAECVYIEIHGMTKLEELDIKEEINLEENSNRNLLNIYDDKFPRKRCDKETKLNMISVETGNIFNDDSVRKGVLEMEIQERFYMGIKKRAICTDEVKERKNITNDLTMSTNAVESDTHKKSLFTSEAKQQPFLKSPMSSHKGTSEGKEKMSYINKQALIQKDISEVKYFKCSSCTYESKRKSALKAHMLVHADVSETKMYQCSLCPYQAKRKGALKVHMLVHKDVSDLKMYKCSFCAYETKRKDSLNTHMLIHQDVSELKMYKCSFCAYETKYKRCLIRHLVVHKDISEMEMYKCSFCTYKTKHKRYLSRHLVIHKDISEIGMYKCSLCTSEFNRKHYLTSHMLLIHNDVTELNMHKCSLCTYETKTKSNLKRHMLIHKDVSEIEMFRCFLCSYETNIKYNLKLHMLVHKDVSKIQMYKCSLCAYEAKQKRYLTKHMLVH